MKAKVSLMVMMLLIFPSLVLPQSDKAKGNKEVVSISDDIEGDFETIEVSDNLKVEIQKSRRNSYVLTTDQNLVDEIEVDVRNGTLKVFTNSKIVKSKKLEVLLNVDQLGTLIINDDASVVINDNFDIDNLKVIQNKKSDLDLDLDVAESFELLLNDRSKAKIGLRGNNIIVNGKGSSRLKANFDSKDLKVNLEKSADVKLDGKADDVEYNLRNNSTLDARKLKAHDALLISKNKADIHVRAGHKIEVDVQGKSKVFVYGNPEVVIKGFTDKSRIIKK